MSSNHKSIPRSISIKWLCTLITIVLISISAGVYFASPIQNTLAKLIPGSQTSEQDHAQHSVSQYYTCGMHPWIILPNPGDCPICFMKLTPIDPDKFSSEITIDPTIVQNMGVRTTPVISGPLVKTIRTVGTVNYNETLVRDIHTKITGWIENLHVNYLGANVKQGDPLFDFYAPELYAAQEEYLIAYRTNRSDDNTLLESARTRLQYYDITNEQITALEKNNKPTKTLSIKSPYTGVVIAKHANEGMKIDQGMQLFRIADLSKVWIIVTFYEYQLPYIKLGNKVTMSLPYIPGHTFEGQVVYIYPYLEKKTREVQVRLEFDNPDGLLKPGMFANVTLENKIADKRTLAPREAILDTGERKIAFVAMGNGRFEPRDIVTGIQTENDHIEILQGLKPGENVVTSGQFLLDSDAKIRAAIARMMPSSSTSQPATSQPASSQPATSQPAVLSQAALNDLDPANQLIHAYLKIQEMLTTNDTANLHMQIQQLKTAAMKMPSSKSLLDVIDFDHSNLKSTRQGFSILSNAVIKWLKNQPKMTSSVNIYQAYCPMVKKNWLQSNKQIRNPYAPTMLECGTIKGQLAKATSVETSEGTNP